MKYFIFTILVSMPSMHAYTQTAPKEPSNVAIFLYENVELLDFAGPAEAFSATGFNTYTVSADGNNLTSQGFVKIQPQYSIEKAPTADIIVLPGGNAGPSADDPRVIEWVRKHYNNKAQIMSVCTGAFILAKAGLLDDKKVTTHHGATQRLRDEYPTTTVLENTRWVDNGLIITTAGVSAGIDGALHMISRVKGEEAAKRVARYMEYDKWDPENGVVNAINSYLHEPTSKLLKVNGVSATIPSSLKTSQAPFIGEYINLAQALEKQNNDVVAAEVIENGLKVYPESAQLYNVLRNIYVKSGKPAPVSEDELTTMMRSGRVDEAIARFEKDKTGFPKWRIFSENEVKSAGYHLLLYKKDIDNAVKVFALNTKEFPNSPDTFDSLGEALLAAGKRKEAIENYKIAATMGYENAKKVLMELDAQ
jgi:putative intracellular protease/amidase